MLILKVISKEMYGTTDPVYDSDIRVSACFDQGRRVHFPDTDKLVQYEENARTTNCLMKPIAWKTVLPIIGFIALIIVATYLGVRLNEYGGKCYMRFVNTQTKMGNVIRNDCPV